MKLSWIALMLLSLRRIAAAQASTCDISGYKPMDGVKAEKRTVALILTWQGEAGQQLMAQFAFRDGQPLVQEFAARSNSGGWINPRKKPHSGFSGDNWQASHLRWLGRVC